MKRTRVLALVPYAIGTAPSQRYRLEQWAAPLTTAGIDIDFSPFAGGELTALLYEPGHVLRKTTLMIQSFRRQVRSVLSSSRYDAVVVHRAACLAGPALLERWIHARALPLIYDFDDAIFLLNAAPANRRFAWLKAPAKTSTICRLADHVVVCNSYLAAYARQRNATVSIVPSSIDTDHYVPRNPSARAPLVLGWMGSSTSLAHLEAELTMLRALLASRPLELRVVSDRRPSLPGLAHTWRPWSAASEVEELAEFDIGIMPLPDDEWARGKCAFKALQYMAMAIPTVAAAVGTNREVIVHGVNGLLADGVEEWLQCVHALVDAPELRGTLGSSGRRTVEEHFSKRSSAAAFERVVLEVARATVR